MIKFFKLNWRVASWGRKSGQHHRLQQKILAMRFTVIFVPLSIALGGFLAAIYFVDYRARLQVMESRSAVQISALKEMLVRDVEITLSDLSFLAKSTNWGKLSEIDRAKLRKDLVVFSKEQNRYDQIRFINQNGIEIVRINHNDGYPKAVESRDLQDKSTRYYFTEAMQLGVNQVYISPFDLNVEQGEIELPAKPMLRFATPLFDDEGGRIGIIILNYIGSELIKMVKSIDLQNVGSYQLVDSDGYWLYGPDPMNDWAFMYDNRKHLSFAESYPAEWGAASTTESGELQTARGRFFFETLRPGLDIQNNYHWKLIVRLTATVLRSEARPTRNKFLVLYVGLLVLAGLSSYLVAFSMLKKQIAENEKKALDYKAQAETIKRLELEGQLQNSQKLESVGRLAGGVAHDFNNLLTTIIGYSDLIAMEEFLDELTEEGIREIKKAAESAASLTQQLLAFSSKQFLRPQLINLNSLVASLRLMMKKLVPGNVTLVVCENGTIGDMNADPVQVERIIMNFRPQ